MAIPILPPSAPFAPAQRAWLNGFFAGVLSMDQPAWSSATAPNAAQFPPVYDGAVAAVAEAEEDFPWHDPTLAIEERLALAEDQPLEWRLMAAMAQLDCGSCGYMCKTYAEAIARGEEQSLTKCVPGGKETAKKLKEIMALAPVA